MKRFISNILLFIGIFLILNIVCVQIIKQFYPTSYAHNEIYAMKYLNYLNNRYKYNTLFFGSSRTYRQINPHIIDSNLRDLKIKSFNLGAPGTFNPEALFLYSFFLKNEPSNSTIKYVFVELTEFTPIASENKLSPRSYYYLNTEFLKLVFKYYYYRNDYSFQEKVKYYYVFLRAYFINNFRINYAKINQAPDYYLGENRDGFYPLDVEVKVNKTKELLERNADLRKDTTIIANVYNQKTKDNKLLDNSSLSFLNKLMLESEKKNIKLYFIIPPRINGQRRFSIVKNELYANAIIDMNDYDKYRELYLFKYNFDYGHLNSFGANIYSFYLANEIRNLLKKPSIKSN